jgi:hypothetical protein
MGAYASSSRCRSLCCLWQAMTEPVAARIEAVCLAGVPYRSLRHLLDVRVVMAVGLGLGLLLRFLNSRRRGWHGHLLPTEPLSLDVRAGCTRVAVFELARRVSFVHRAHAFACKLRSLFSESSLWCVAFCCDLRIALPKLPERSVCRPCMCLLCAFACRQSLAVLAALLCTAFLVAFAGVPLVLPVLTDNGRKDAHAFEAALKHARVLDEGELRSGPTASSYVPWSEREAAAVQGASGKAAAGATPVGGEGSPRYTLRQRKAVA